MISCKNKQAKRISHW